MAFTDLIRLSRLRPRKGVIGMVDVGLLVGGLALLAVFADRILRKFEAPSRKFPWCRTCGKNMVSVPLSKALPDEIRRYLEHHELPPVVASKFICPKGCYQLWFIPKFSNTDKAFLLR